jgi:hypothetical protein
MHVKRVLTVAQWKSKIDKQQISNYIGSDIEFILRGRSVLYIYVCMMNNAGPRIDPSQSSH